MSYEDVVLSDLICLSRAIHRVVDLFVSVHFHRARQRVCVCVRECGHAHLSLAHSLIHVIA